LTLAWAKYLSRDLISGGAARDLFPDDQLQFPRHLSAKSVELVIGVSDFFFTGLAG